MEQLGTDFNATGSVMSRAEVEDQRRRRGECVTCGRKCYQKKLLRMIPLTEHGRVDNGRCLNCHPLDAGSGTLAAEARVATPADLAREARRTQQQHSSSSSSSVARRKSSASADSRKPSSTRRPRGPPSSAHSSSRSLQTRQSVGSNSSSFQAPGTSEFQSSTGSSGRRFDGPRPSIARPDSMRSVGGNSIYSARSRTSADGGSSGTSRQELSTVVHRSIEELENEASRSEFAGEDVDTQLDYYQRSHHGHSARSLRSHESHEPREGIVDRDGALLFEHRMASQRGRPPDFRSEQHPGDVGTRRFRKHQQYSTRSLGSSGGSSFEAEEDVRSLANGGVSIQHPTQNSSDHASLSERGDAKRPAMSSTTSLGDTSVDEESESRAIQRMRAAENDFLQIMDCMRDHPDSADVQACGLEAISNVEFSPEDAISLIENGFIQLTSEAMQGFPDDFELQLFACRAIWNASEFPETQCPLIDLLDNILSVMTNCLANAAFQEQVLTVLANLGASAENIPLLQEKGAVKKLVESMNKHANNCDVQMKGCLALTNMAAHPDIHKEMFVQNGAASAVVISMVMHPGEPGLQEKALEALRNLSAECDSNIVELTNIGGIDAIISAMQVHRDAAGVQEAGSWTLANLATNHDSNVLIGDCGGIEVIVRAMWVHDKQADVLVWCCKAISELGLDQHNAQLVLGFGGIKAIVNAMQNHVDNPSVQEMACSALHSLAFDVESKTRVVDEEALDAVVLAMFIHGENEVVNANACHLLLNLSIAENFRALQASNVGELVRSAAARFPETCNEPAERLIQVIEGFLSEYT